MKKSILKKFSLKLHSQKTRFFLYFGKWSFLPPRLKNFPILSQKKLFLYFGKMKFLSPKLKKLLFFFLKKIYIYFRKELPKPEKTNISDIILNIFKIIVSYNYNKTLFPRFFALFLFYNFFFYSQKAFVFHILVDFCIAHDHIVALFSFSSLERLWYLSRIFFITSCSLSFSLLFW